MAGQGWKVLLGEGAVAIHCCPGEVTPHSSRFTAYLGPDCSGGQERDSPWLRRLSGQSW